MRGLFYSDDQPTGNSASQPHPPAAADDSWWREGEAGDVPSAETPDDQAATPAEHSSSEGAITSPLPAIVAPTDMPPEPVSVAPLPPSMRGLAFAAVRDIGQIRTINQDSVFGMLITVPRADGDVPIGLFIVADGMGGHEGGEVASRIAISTVARVVLADLVVPALDEAMTEPLQSLMTGALQEANRAIWDQAQTIGSDMGTTCTAALLIGHTIYIGHVGDSRTYLITPDAIRPLTIDHSAVGRLIEMGQIDASEAREHPLRSHLYRTVGQMPEVAVDYDYTSVSGATHLLICSDGLWSMIGEAEMHAAIIGATWPQDACNDLIARANAAGGEDNISAVVVSLPSSA